MSIKRLSDKNVAITRKLALEVAGMDACTAEVPYYAEHAEYLATLFESGRYHAARWALAYCHADGRWYRVDGKHTATLFATGRVLLDGREARVIRVECDTFQDVIDFFNEFDQSECARDSKEVNMSIKASIVEFRDLSNDVINKCVSGIEVVLRNTLMEDGTRPKKTATLGRAVRLREEIPFVLFVNSMIYDCPGCTQTAGHLKVVPFIAAMYMMFNDNPALARDFIPRVRDGEDLASGDPDWSLHRYMLKARQGNGRKDKEGVTKQQIIKKCLAEFDAFKAKKLGAKSNSPKPRYGARGSKRKALVNS